jgi:hypothetical protein
MSQVRRFSVLNVMTVLPLSSLLGRDAAPSPVQGNESATESFGRHTQTWQDRRMIPVYKKTRRYTAYSAHDSSTS